MKYNVTPLTSQQYLNLVNQEEDPSQDKLNIKYAQMGTSFFAYANTTVGKIVSPSFNKNGEHTDQQIDEYFDQATKDITSLYEEKKKGMITPGAFVVDPSRTL